MILEGSGNLVVVRICRRTLALNNKMSVTPPPRALPVCYWHYQSRSSRRRQHYQLRTLHKPPQQFARILLSRHLWHLSGPPIAIVVRSVMAMVVIWACVGVLSTLSVEGCVTSSAGTCSVSTLTNGRVMWRSMERSLCMLQPRVDTKAGMRCAWKAKGITSWTSRLGGWEIRRPTSPKFMVCGRWAPLSFFLLASDLSIVAQFCTLSDECMQCLRGYKKFSESHSSSSDWIVPKRSFWSLVSNLPCVAQISFPSDKTMQYLRVYMMITMATQTVWYVVCMRGHS